MLPFRSRTWITRLCLTDNWNSGFYKEPANCISGAPSSAVHVTKYLLTSFSMHRLVKNAFECKCQSEISAKRLDSSPYDYHLNFSALCFPFSFFLAGGRLKLPAGPTRFSSKEAQKIIAWSSSQKKSGNKTLPSSTKLTQARSSKKKNVASNLPPKNRSRKQTVASAEAKGGGTSAKHCLLR